MAEEEEEEEELREQNVLRRRDKSPGEPRRKVMKPGSNYLSTAPRDENHNSDKAVGGGNVGGGAAPHTNNAQSAPTTTQSTAHTQVTKLKKKPTMPKPSKREVRLSTDKDPV